MAKCSITVRALDYTIRQPTALDHLSSLNYKKMLIIHATQLKRKTENEAATPAKANCKNTTEMSKLAGVDTDARHRRSSLKVCMVVAAIRNSS